MSSRPSLYSRIKIILESARAGISRTVNTTQVITRYSQFSTPRVENL